MDGSKACFSLDHEQLWEMRDSWDDTPKAGFQDYLKNPEKFFDGTYFRNEGKKINYYRTKLPGLSFSIEFEEEITEFYGELDYLTATAEITFTLRAGKKAHCTIYLDSNENLLKIKMDHGPCKFHASGWDMETGNLSVLKRWGYPSYTKEQDMETTHIYQPYSENGIAVLSACARGTEIYATLEAKLETGEDGRGTAAGELAEKNRRLLTRYQQDEEKFLQCHKQSWATYWDRSDITMPNNRLQQAYDAEMYKIFCNERADGFPVTLQGIWNNDFLS